MQTFTGIGNHYLVILNVNVLATTVQSQPVHFQSGANSQPTDLTTISFTTYFKHQH